MINGHGDDIHNYKGVRSNFSSNIYAGFSYKGLYEFLSENMHRITSYPEPTPSSLEYGLARKLGVEPANVMVTNGATEAIYLIARAYANRQAIVMQPTFAEYADASIGNNGSKRIRWICNPNNPTGHVVAKTELLDAIVYNRDDIFVIDASYARYTDKDVIQATEIVNHHNAMMLGSMTKEYGVPGLRLGYVVADATILDSIRRLCMPWSVNALAIEAGHYFLEHQDDYHIPLEMLLTERKRIEQAMHQMGITTAHSDSHMLLCCLPHGTASELKEYLVWEHGILVRDAGNFATLTPQHFRIAVQTASQNDELLNALKQWIVR